MEASTRSVQGKMKSAANFCALEATGFFASGTTRSAKPWRRSWKTSAAKSSPPHPDPLPLAGERGGIRGALPPVLQLREQPEHLEVEPHQRHQQRERAVPLHVSRRPALRALLDEVEVQNQIQRRDAGDEQA